jgi:hypothetical protein
MAISPTRLVVDFFVGVQVPPAVTLLQPVTGGRWQYANESPAHVVVVALLVVEANVVCETVLEVVEVDVPLEVASVLVVEVPDATGGDCGRSRSACDACARGLRRYSSCSRWRLPKKLTLWLRSLHMSNWHSGSPERQSKTGN